MKNATRTPLLTALGRSLLALLFLVLGSSLMAGQKAQAQCVSFELTSYPTKTFFVETDKSPVEVGNYVSIKVTPNQNINDLTVAIGGFDTAEEIQSGIVSDTVQTFENVTAGSPVYAFFYVTAPNVTGDVAATQNYRVAAYDDPPNFVSSCADTQFEFIDNAGGTPEQYQAIEDALNAQANKISSITLENSNYVVGGGFDLVVEGFFGNVGSPGAVAYTPASFADWPSDVFELQSSEILLSPFGGAANVGQCPNQTYQSFKTNSLVLSIPSDVQANDLDKTCYRVRYTFRIAGTTGSSTPVSPRSFISSGNPAKISNPSTSVTIPTIDTSPIVLDKESFNPDSGADDQASLEFGENETSKTVTYQLTITNTGTSTVKFNDIVDDLPSSQDNPFATTVTYNSPTASVTTPTTPASVCTIADEPQSTQETSGGEIIRERLKWIGPCELEAGEQVVVTYDVTVPSPGSEGTTTEWVNDGAVRVEGSVVSNDQVILGGSVLPVELTSFEATVDGEDVILRWTTASETNNAGFEVQQLEAGSAAKTWSTLTFVEGHGTTELPKAYRHRATTLTPGTHTFRLRQVDFDGAFEYSPEVEVVVGLPDQYVVEPAYPNPFNPEATLRFAVQQEQRVEVGLYNLLGQRVRTLFAGTATAGQMQRVTIDGANLSSGVYLVRVQGERFLETQRVTLVK